MGDYIWKIEKLTNNVQPTQSYTIQMVLQHFVNDISTDACSNILESKIEFNLQTDPKLLNSTEITQHNRLNTKQYLTDSD